ncbi:hypothetical protein B0J14DRAFT_695843 [Halenospora varia]|nr:hypothetical protein B0J14DRAFT_695843 [Halenospora varia]
MESKYSRIDGIDPDDDSVEDLPIPHLYRRFPLGKFLGVQRRPKSSLVPKYLTIYLKFLKDILIYSLALWGAYSILRYLVVSRNLTVHGITSDFERRPGCDCGDSVAEAISLGCKFDSLSMAWLPEHCRDDDLTAEFDTAGNGPNGTWIYWADTDHTIEMNVETVAAMGDDPSARAHMGTTWHRVHCVFYWRKLFRTKFNGKIIEPRSDTEDHIKHCGMVFQEPGYGTISGVALNTNEVVAE